MLEPLLFIYLERRKVPGNFTVHRLEEDGIWKYRVEMRAAFSGMVMSAATSPDRDRAIQMALEGVDFEPGESECSCDHVAGPEFVDDDCCYHVWEQLKEASRAE